MLRMDSALEAVALALICWPLLEMHSHIRGGGDGGDDGDDGGDGGDDGMVVMMEWW